MVASWWHSFLQFCRREVVLVISLILAIVTTFMVPFSFPRIVSSIDWRVLGCLASLMLVVKGFQKQQVFVRLARVMLGKATSDRSVAAVLVGITFCTSMLVTNDVALITFVPFAIAVCITGGMWSSILPIVVLQTVAANIGSALTPFGNPQNLYLYSYYQMHAGHFFLTMLPFTLVGAVALAVGILVLFRSTSGSQRIEQHADQAQEEVPPMQVAALVRYGVLFVVALCAVFSVLPWYAATLVVAIAMWPDRELYRKIDWSLLATFIGFFVFIGNCSSMPTLTQWFVSLLQRSVFATSFLASQVISNVPAALLLSHFTSDGTQLLLGVNAGGLGTLIASLASVISYKYYAQLSRENGTLVPSTGKYMLWFTIINVLVAALLWLSHLIIWGNA